MGRTKSKIVPLPCAFFALSVVVCLGSSASVEASALRVAVGGQAEQRQSLEHLLEAIQLAAKRLTDQLESQSVLSEHRARPFASIASKCIAPVRDYALAIPILRETLLNLPPPLC